MFEVHPPKSVVVAIDGSQAALRAARWAVDEVAGTDIPLRLLYIRKPNPPAGWPETPELLATAEDALHEAYNAIDAVGQPVKVEMEIVEDHPVRALIHASDSTALLCIGATGSALPGDGFGSTAAELVQSAHCPVAVIRGDDSGQPMPGRWIVALVHESPDDDNVLQLAFYEAQQRNAPLVVMTAWRSGFDDLQDDRVVADRELRARAVLDRYMADWIPYYPEVEVRTVVAYGMFLDYLAEHAKAIQLVVIGATHSSEVQQLVGPAAAVALCRSDFSLLVIR